MRESHPVSPRLHRRRHRRQRPEHQQFVASDPRRLPRREDPITGTGNAFTTGFYIAPVGLMLTAQLLLRKRSMSRRSRLDGRHSIHPSAGAIAFTRAFRMDSKASRIPL